MRISLIVAIFLLSIAFHSRSEEKETFPDPSLMALKALIQRELHELEPTIKVEEKSLTLRYKTRNYMVYSVSMQGRIGKKLMEREGPDDEGVLLRVYMQTKGEDNQFYGAQTHVEPYWKTYLNTIPIKNSEKQVFVTLSYGPRTDKDLISKLKSIAEQAGTGQPATQPRQAKE
jgi:hypothetical protein